jgi:hypothetical protein
MDTNYKLYLYKPAGQASDFLGELLVDNLNAQIKLHDISTISFTIPESINGVANTRLDEVLDSYVVELRYGKDVVLDNGEHSKIRFTIFSTPLEFSDNIRKYSYSGYSLESLLEFKNITNWAGIEVKDFFRTVKYNNNAVTPRFTEPGTPSNFSYTISTSSNTRGTKYITVSPTTATVTPLDIFIYEVRQDTTVSGSIKEVPYVRYTGTGVNDTSFRDGYYFLTLNGSGNITSISIAVPGNYDNFNALALTTQLFFKVYDNPLSRHFAIGVNRTTEDPYTDMYVDLAHQANLGDTTPTYGSYTFSTQSIYSKNGLKLEQVLLGRTDTRDGSYNLINNTATTDGLLYSTGFTIGTIDPVIAGNAAETIVPMYRSNLEFNNITRYQAIKDLAESFDAIAVFNTVAKTVSFYPQDNSLTSAWPNNGLIIKYGTYLQSITKEIDASKIVTSAKALGKDNLIISLITPDGNDAWEDFSYYLDSYYISNASTQIEDIENNITTGIAFDYVNTSNYKSRWMEVGEAIQVAKWQYARDYFHEILLGNVYPSISAHQKYYDLYNLRSEAINNYVTKEREFITWRAEQYKYKYLYDYYYNLKQNGGTDSNDLDRLDYYEDLWNGVQPNIIIEEEKIEDLRKEIFPENQNEIVENSIADYLSEVKSFLNKSNWSINTTKLEPFIRQTVMSDNKLDNDLDLLKAAITHVNENKVPKVTLKTNIVSIISAQEAYEDWNKLKTGDLINIYFDEFNINLVAQIKEVSIDFEQHTVDLTISTVHNYNTGFGRYVTKTLRRLYNSDTNVTKHLEDANRISSAETAEVYNQLNNGSISADNSQITLGSTNSEGTQSTSFSATGVNSLVIESVDAVLEIPTFSADKGVAIADGTITAYYDRGAGDVTTEVEISGANGFVIRNTDNDTGIVSTVAYIDEGTGEAYFAGWKLEEGQFSGAGTDSSFVGINSEDPLLETGTENKTYAFWAGDETASEAPFSVTKAGAIKATAGTIAGLNVGTGYISDANKIAETNPKNAIFKRTGGGAGVFGEDQTKIYIDEDGRFSLSDELKWDGETFFVNGTIEATIGQIGGWKVDDNTLTSVDNSNVLTPNIQLDRSGRILIAGSTFGGTDNEYITDARIIIDNTGITGNDGTNTTFRLTTGGVLTAARIVLDSEDYSIRIGDLITDSIQNIAGNYGLSVQNSTAIQNPNNIPYQVTVSEDGFFITTVSATSGTDRALAVQYDYDRIWAKRLVISDLLPEDSTLQTEEQALLEASTLIGRLSSTEHGVRVVQEITETDKFNIIKMTTEGFAIYQNEETLSGLTNPTFQVEIDGSISATSLKITGTSELGGWEVRDDYFESTNHSYATYTGETEPTSPTEGETWFDGTDYKTFTSGVWVITTQPVFSTSGIRFNNNGTIIAKQFAIDSTGDAFFRGNLDAASGTFGTVAADKGNVLLGGSDPLVVRNNETNILRLTNAGVLTIGNWTVDDTSISAANLVLQYDATNPYISIGQTTEGYNNAGAFFGLNSAVAKFSVRGTGEDPNFLRWTGTALELKGNLSGEISAINIDNVTIDANGIRAQIDGSSPAVYSFYLNADDGRGGIAGWEIDSNNITSETNKVQLQKEGKILVGGSTVDVNGDVNNATLIIDGTATGASPVLDHANFELRADGSAIFSGALQAASGSFSGQITANSGSIAGFTIENTVLTAGSLSAGGSGSNVGLTPDAGASNVSIWAGASIASGTVPTNAEVAAAPFRVTKTGDFFAGENIINFLDFESNFTSPSSSLKTGWSHSLIYNTHTANQLCVVTSSRNTNGPTSAKQGSKYLVYNTGTLTTVETKTLTYSFGSATTVQYYLSFYYFLDSNNAHILSVTDNTSKTLWQRNYFQAKEWQKAVIELPIGITSVTINFIRRGSAAFDISLDDIIIYTPNISKSGNNLNISGLIETGNAQFGPVIMKQESFVDVKTINSFYEEALGVPTSILNYNDGSNVFIKFKTSNQLPAVLKKLTFTINTGFTSLHFLIGYGYNNFRLPFVSPVFISPYSAGNPRTITISGEDGDGLLGDGILCNEIYFYQGDINGANKRAYSVNSIGSILVEESYLNIGNRSHFFGNGWASLEEVFVSGTTIRNGSLDLAGSGPSGTSKLLSLFNPLLIQAYDSMTLNSSELILDIKGKTIVLPDENGTIGVFQSSSSTNRNIQFRVGRHDANVPNDGIVNIAFGSAFPQSLTYGVIVSGHRQDDAGLLGTTAILYGADTITRSGFRFANDSGALARGFSWIAFAY